jgi:hypothetical protein
MQSTISPTKLKNSLIQEFKPRVTFPCYICYRFNISSYDLTKFSHLASLRLSSDIKPRPSDTLEDVALLSNANEPGVLYLLDPKTYPPNVDGFDKFRKDLQSAAHNES